MLRVMVDANELRIIYKALIEAGDAVYQYAERAANFYGACPESRMWDRKQHIYLKMAYLLRKRHPECSPQERVRDFCECPDCADETSCEASDRCGECTGCSERAQDALEREFEEREAFGCR